jgi:hypothetical protein
VVIVLEKSQDDERVLAGQEIASPHSASPSFLVVQVKAASGLFHHLSHHYYRSGLRQKYHPHATIRIGQGMVPTALVLLGE